MKTKSYKIIKSEPMGGLVEGREVTPYFEDSNEIIINGPRPDVDHHIRKNGTYFAEHFEPAGGK